MRISASLVAILLSSSVGCSKERSPSSAAPSQATPVKLLQPVQAPDAATPRRDSQRVPEIRPMSSAVSFCSGRVYPGSGSHISWEAFHTTASLEDVVQHYASGLGTAQVENTGEARWSFPKEKPTMVLHVQGIDGMGPWKRECGTPDGATTVITLSSMPR